MTTTFNEQTTFCVWPCPNCGVRFGVPADFDKSHRQTGATFYCPNGHSMSYDSEAEKTRRERDLLKQRLAQKDDEIARQRSLREQTERQLSASRGQITKLKKRASAGVCPCCTRSFTNLRRHMETKHPEFATDNVVPLKAESA